MLRRPFFFLLALAFLAASCQEKVVEKGPAGPMEGHYPPAGVPMEAELSYPWTDPVPGVADPEALLAEVVEAYAGAETMGALVHTVETAGEMAWESEGTLRLRRPNYASWVVLGGQRPRAEKTDGRFVWHYSPADNEFAATDPPDDPLDIPSRLGLPLAGALFYGAGLESIASPWAGELVGPLLSGPDEAVGRVASHRLDAWLRLAISEGMVGHLSVWVGKEDKLVRRVRLVVGRADTEGWDQVRLADSFLPGDIREEVYVQLETNRPYTKQTFRRTFPVTAEEVVPPATQPEEADPDSEADSDTESAGAGAGGAPPAPAPTPGG